MRDLQIAYGSSRKSRKWVNKTISFDALKARLKVTIRTPESAEEYSRMAKTKKETAKDHGGFVAGMLSKGFRKIENVACRSMISLDGDQIEARLISDYENLVHHASVLYTTHSHTPEHPRARLVFPLTRNVSAEEFVAVSRYLAQQLGIEQFDECSYLPNQLMYWPSTPLNGEFIFKESQGEWLNPDTILRAHPEWKDPAMLPTSSRESQANSVNFKKVEDPLKKRGVIGLFNRAYYPIETALDELLSDVYERTECACRYHLIESSSMAGVEIKDNGRFVYSHHAKDAAYLKLCNAFDIVRIHKFPDEDEKASYSAMCEFAMSLDKVRIFVANEKMENVTSDFAEDEDNWKSHLTYMPKSGLLENSVANLTLILNNDPDFQGFAYNELANRIQIIGKLPWDRPAGNTFWRDADTAQIKAIIDSRYLPFSTRNHDVAFSKVADDRHFHPIRNYLDNLPEWDGEIRVEDLFIKYLNADDTEYVRSVTRKTFAGAIARIYKPGIKFDCVPVLDGAQGIGKSSIIKDLVKPEYYSEALSLTDMNDKAAAEKLQGFWIVEIGELAGMKKADIEKVKSFLSTSDDKYRPSYGKTVESHPRQCIIIATVNGERGYLRDITGNRRFWIIKARKENQGQAWKFNQNYRDQFWAEAKQIWESGEKLYLEGELLAESEKVQREAMEIDDRIGMVETYLNTKLPSDWDSMNIYDRRIYLSDRDSMMNAPGIVVRTEVSNAEIWCECFGRNFSDLKSKDSYSISALMMQLGSWERTNTARKLPIYGRQRIYKRLGR